MFWLLNVIETNSGHYIHYAKINMLLLLRLITTADSIIVVDWTTTTELPLLPLIGSMYLIKYLDTTTIYIKFSPLTTAQLLPSYLDMATHNTYGLTTTTFLLPHTRKTYSHARHSNTVIPPPR